jgi:hypothetical protein
VASGGIGVCYATGLGTQMVEMNAYCLWLGSWYAAQDARNTAAAAAAREALAQVRDWGTFTDTNISDQGFRKLTQTTIDAVFRGDAAAVLRQLEVNGTGTWTTGR